MKATATLPQRGLLPLLLALLLPQLSNAQYCTPVYTMGCAVGDYIHSFSTTGGTTNISNLNSGCNGNPSSYIYYPNAVVTAAPGNTVAWSITNCPNFAQGFAIWVDYNQNGSFTDAGEQVYVSNNIVQGGATVTGSFTVPLTAPAGPTRMRVRSSFMTGQATPCGSVAYGETEDYGFTVSGVPSGCTTAPAPGTISALPSAICLSSPVTLMLTGYTAGSLLQWQQASGSVWTNIAGATGSALQLPNPTPSGFYRVVATCPGTTLSATSAAYQVTVGNSPSCRDSVWPGDANYDHIVNNLDPLAIALAYNFTGTPRPGASISYVAQYATNWPTNSVNNATVNHKHADCNGDSSITNADLAAVTANYGLTHPRFRASNAKVAGLPDLQVDLTGVSLIPGSMATVPIRFGAPGSEVEKIYGLAGTLQLQGFTPSAPPGMTFYPGLFPPLHSLHFHKAINNNFIDWAVSRTDHTNGRGAGIVGYVSFMVPPTAGGQVTFHLQDVTLVDSAGAVLGGYNVQDNSAFIQPTGIGATGRGATAAAIVPNPSGSAAQLQLQLTQPAGIDVTVTDMTGRRVWQQGLHAAAGATALPLPAADLAAGIYVVRIRLAGDGAVQVLQWVRR